MPSLSLSRSAWASAMIRLWKGTSRRRRFVLAGLFVASLIGGWFTWTRWSEWTIRMVLQGQGKPLPMAFSPDSKILASARANVFTIWDVTTGRERSRWTLPASRPVFDGAFSPDGRTFVAAWQVRGIGYPIVLDLIDVATGQVRSTIATPGNAWFGMTFLPDGRGMRVVVTDGTFRRAVHAVDVDLATGRASSIRRLSNPSSYHRWILSVDGRYLAAYFRTSPTGMTAGSAVLIWDVELDHEETFLTGLVETSTAWDLAFAPDGKTLAVGREDGSIELWDLSTRRLRDTFRSHSEGFGFPLLKFAPDGSSLVSSGRLIGSRHQLSRIPQELGRLFRGRIHDHPMEVVALDPVTGRVVGRAMDEGRPIISPDGRTLATFSLDGTIKIRDLPGKR